MLIHVSASPSTRRIKRTPANRSNGKVKPHSPDTSASRNGRVSQDRFTNSPPKTAASSELSTINSTPLTKRPFAGKHQNGASPQHRGREEKRRHCYRQEVQETRAKLDYRGGE